MIRMIAIAVALAGCAVGAGSAYVGQWAPKKQVDFEACLLDETATAQEPRCKDTKQVTTEVPGRRYWGVVVAFPAIGGSRVGYEGTTETVFRLEPSLEILKGRGRFALGVRGGVVLDTNVGSEEGVDAEQGGVGGAWTTNLIGHVSLFDELSLYAGVGHAVGGVGGETTFAGARGLAGLRFALSKTHSETFIIFSLELDRMYLKLDDTYRSTGITGNFGIFL